MYEIKVLSEEILKLPSTHCSGIVEKLSVLDICQPKIYVTFCYFFKNDGDMDYNTHIETLKTGLKIALNEYPELAGTIEYKQDGGYLNHENHGIKVTLSSANFSFAEVKKRNFELKKFPESHIFPAEVQGFVFSKDAYLLIINLISLTDNSLMLAVDVHHVLCDAHGLFRFLNAWGCATKKGNIGEYKNETKRSALVGNGKNPMDNVERGYVSLSGPPGSLPIMKFTAHLFNVTFDKLEHLKQQYSKQLPANKFLSKNDILTAVIWKAAVKSRLHTQSESSMCETAVNCRKRFGLPDNYFGNCVPMLCQRLKTEDIVKMSVMEMACKIRGNYAIMTREFLTDILNWFEKKESLMNIMPSANIFGNDLLFSSLAQHPIYDVDFGLGKPHNVCAQTNTGLPGIVWVFPSADAKSLRVEFCLEESEMIIFLDDPDVKDLLQILH